MSQPPEVASSVFTSSGNVDRKKYDPIYEIVVHDGEEDVIYIGRLFAFEKVPTLVTIKGVEYLPSKKKSSAKMTAEDARKLLEGFTTEDSFPASSLGRIRKIA